MFQRCHACSRCSGLPKDGCRKSGEGAPASSPGYRGKVISTICSEITGRLSSIQEVRRIFLLGTQWFSTRYRSDWHPPRLLNERSDYHILNRVNKGADPMYCATSGLLAQGPTRWHRHNPQGHDPDARHPESGWMGLWPDIAGRRFPGPRGCPIGAAMEELRDRERFAIMISMLSVASNGGRPVKR